MHHTNFSLSKNISVKFKI
ncbi:collagen type IV alpha-3-binding protein [Trichinella spiralis]|nr:collagen type IV alpha-3-binding protein [Trichinella spiralis]